VSQVVDLAQQTAESRAAIEAISPSHEPDAMPRELEFDWITPQGQPIKKRYIQAQLGLFAVEEFTTKITEIIDSFVKGDFGMKIGELFRGEVEMPVTLDAEATQDFVDENEQLIQAAVKLVQIIPSLRLDITCWSLGVPRLEVPWAKEQLSEAPYRGGLSVEEGMDILIVFIKQNIPLLRKTLLGKGKELAEEFRLLVASDEEETPTSSPSTPQSSETATPETTPAVALATPGGTP
jgi:hypothetical protein